MIAPVRHSIAVCAAVLAYLVFHDIGFVSMDRVRVKLVETSQVATGNAIQVDARALDTIAAVRQPLALIIRIRNAESKPLPLAVSVDGKVVCHPVLPPGVTRRVDCAVPMLDPVYAPHAVVLDGPSSGWSLEFLEVATHYGFMTDVGLAVILPAGSGYGSPPSAAEAALFGGGVVLFLLLVPASTLPRWARFVHVGLTGLIVLTCAAAVVSQSVSRYRIAISAGTLWAWTSMVCLPQLITVWRWLAEARPKGSAVVVAARPLLVAALVFSAFYADMRQQRDQVHHGNYSGFLHISRGYFEVNPLFTGRDDVRRTLALEDVGGYDGQFMYAIAFDPLLRTFRATPGLYRDAVDGVSYRWSRVGFSAITHVVSLGHWQRYAATMIWLVLVGLGAAALVLAALAQREQVTPLCGLLILFVPGFWQSLQAGLPEPLAAALLLAAVYIWTNLDGRYWLARTALAAALACVSMLMRETGLVLVTCIAAQAAWRGQRGAAILLWLAAVAPLIAWHGFIGWVMYPVLGLRGFLDQPRLLELPFAGMAELWHIIHAGNYFNDSPDMVRAGLMLPALLTGALALACSMAATLPSSFNVAAVLYGLMAVCLNYKDVWLHVGNAQRTSYELFIALAIASLGFRKYPTPVRILTTTFWGAAAVYVFYGAFDAQGIRAALSPF